MSLRVRLRPEAERDLKEAATWYEGQRAGLGDEFPDEALRTFEKIAESPASCPEVHRETRRALFRRFPFGVYFKIQDHGAVVIAIMHASRHPHRWQTRS